MTRVLFTLGVGLLATGLFYGGAGAAYWAIEDLPDLRPGLLLFAARALWLALEPVSLGLALGLWLLNGCLAVMAILMSGFAARAKPDRRPGRRAGLAVWFLHFAVAAHLALTAPAMGYFADLFGIFGVMALPLLWGEIAAALLALLFINRWRRALGPDLAAAAIAAAAFGGAIWQTPTLYGWDLQPMGWYAWLVIGVPFALLAGRALGRAPALSRARAGAAPRLRGGVTLAIMAATIAAAPAVMYTTAAPPETFFTALEESLESDARQVSFARLTHLEWDFVEVYATSASSGGSAKRIDHISPAARRIVDTSTWAYMRLRDHSYHIVVFIKDGKAVYYEKIPALRVWFEDSGAVNPIVARYDTANFRVRYRAQDNGNGNGNGNRVYLLRLAKEKDPSPQDAQVSRLSRPGEKL